MRILRYDGDTALIEVYLAPGIVSRNIVGQLKDKISLMLAEFDKTNAFMKKIYRRDDYFAVIAVESSDFGEVLSIASSVEHKTRRAASQVKSSISSAIQRL